MAKWEPVLVKKVGVFTFNAQTKSAEKLFRISLTTYYKAASEKAEDIAKKLINLEERLVVDLRAYL